MRFRCWYLFHFKSPLWWQCLL